MVDREEREVFENPESVEEWLYGDPVVPEESANRRWIIWLVAAITAAVLAILPLYSLFDRATPQIADNGLEVCGFDYCVVQQAMRDQGVDGEMVQLANIYLNDSDAALLVDQLVAGLGEEPVGLVLVDRISGDIAGQYDPTMRTITIERPVTAWIVAHEVAHVVSAGHDSEFQETLAGLALTLTGG